MKNQATWKSAGQDVCGKLPQHRLPHLCLKLAAQPGCLVIQHCSAQTGHQKRVSFSPVRRAMCQSTGDDLPLTPYAVIAYAGIHTYNALLHNTLNCISGCVKVCLSGSFESGFCILYLTEPRWQRHLHPSGENGSTKTKHTRMCALTEQSRADVRPDSNAGHPPSSAKMLFKLYHEE